MRATTVRSRCECQSLLVATLNENRHVVSAYVVDRRGGEHESAPAHSMDATHARFDVGWLCPVCGRNTLRSFFVEGLEWTEHPDPVPPPPPAPATPPTGG